MKNIVRGGQGRKAKSIEDSGEIIWISLKVFLLVAALCWLASLCGCTRPLPPREQDTIENKTKAHYFTRPTPDECGPDFH